MSIRFSVLFLGLGFGVLAGRLPLSIRGLAKARVCLAEDEQEQIEAN